MAVRINRVYTKTGDDGGTHLVGGHRVGKDDLRIECYGTVDELNSALGIARLHAQAPEVRDIDEILMRVQAELFNLGSQLATRAEDIRPTQPVIHERHVTRLEREIDGFNDSLPELKSFVLPGGGPLGAHLHVGRTICRRAERLAVALGRRETVAPEVIRYLNRLSDALFVLARAAAQKTGHAEVLWQPEVT